MTPSTQPGGPFLFLILFFFAWLGLSPSLSACSRPLVAMAPRLTFEYNPLSYEYPDDESDKELSLQVCGTRANHHHLDRAVLLYWVNMVFSDGEEVWQVVRLDQRDNIHKYVYPDMIVVDECEREHNDTFSLGVFSRDQREALLECAEEVEYVERSGDEGQCLRWMSRLLTQMTEEGLVEEGVVDAIRRAVPLLSLDDDGRCH